MRRRLQDSRLWFCNWWWISQWNRHLLLTWHPVMIFGKIWGICHVRLHSFLFCQVRAILHWISVGTPCSRFHILHLVHSMRWHSTNFSSSCHACHVRRAHCQVTLVFILAPRKPVEMSHSFIFYLSRRLSWGIFNDTIFRAFWGWVDRLISLPLRVPGFPIEYSISSPIIIIIFN